MAFSIEIPLSLAFSTQGGAFLLKSADKQAKYSFIPQRGFSLATDLVILSGFVHPQRGMGENESVWVLSCAIQHVLLEEMVWAGAVHAEDFGCGYGPGWRSCGLFCLWSNTWPLE